MILSVGLSDGSSVHSGIGGDSGSGVDGGVDSGRWLKEEGGERRC